MTRHHAYKAEIVRTYPIKAALTILTIGGDSMRCQIDGRLREMPRLGARMAMRYGTGHRSLYTVMEVVRSDEFEGDGEWDMPHDVEVVLLPFHPRIRRGGRRMVRHDIAKRENWKI
jgi:hypothetical protein